MKASLRGMNFDSTPFDSPLEATRQECRAASLRLSKRLMVSAIRA